MNRLLAFLLLMTAGLQAQTPGTGCSPGVNGCGMWGVTAAQVIPSASTITPSSSMVVISGTAAIATIAAYPGQNQCIDILATSAWTTTTGGNIQAAMTAVANTIYRACYFTNGGTSKWFIK